MHLVLFNIQWMSFNVFLAMVPVVFGLLFGKSRSLLAKIIYGSIWLVFLPNTIYLLTDIAHFFHDWDKVEALYKFPFILEYLILMFLGITSFLTAMYPIEHLIQRTKKNKIKQREEIMLYGINFLVGFGLVLGRVERINSWDIITNTSWVIYQSIHTFTSIYLTLLVIFFGLFSNLIYFSFRDLLHKSWSYLFA